MSGTTGSGESPGMAEVPRGRLRRRMRATPVRTRILVSVGVAVALLVVVARAVVIAPQLRAGKLDCSYGWRWVADVDADAAVTSRANGHDETDVPLRPNGEQGFELQIRNSTGLTQTVLGVATDGPGPVAFGATRYALRFTTEGTDRTGLTNGPFVDQPPVSIKPGGVRMMSFTWGPASLPYYDMPGGSASIDTLSLRVRVGWYTRTEKIASPEAFGITFTSATDACANVPGH
jgi:hypothetical protein